ncbi:Na+/H+ antiporter NhaC [Verrucomicrobiaceae bacterium 227]
MPEQANSTPESPKVREARFWEAILPVIALVVMIYLSVVKFETSAHIALLLATAVAALVGLRIGHRWSKIEDGIIDGISVGMKAILILMVIGMLIATWILSGVVPIMIYHGLNLLSPSIFLVATCLICSIISTSTGSSWTTAGTVGVALIGVGQGLNIPLPMVAGAIISGSYFGDKLSPLSDTTNLAPAVAGAELFDHIRYMLWTTVPAFVISLIIYGVIGLSFQGELDVSTVQVIRGSISEQFSLNPILFLPPLLVVAMVVFKLPALPALLVGSIVGGGFAMVFQGSSTREILAVAFDGYVSESGNAALDELLSRGGMDSMMFTVALIICALGFGGVMERAGLLRTLAGAILSFARGTGRLVTSTILTCLGMNIMAPDQYLAIVVPGRMYRDAYREANLEPRLLSRTLEDSGTLTSPLVAWNTCGAFMSTTLGVSCLSYAPYAFLNLLCPAIAIIYGFTGWTIQRTKTS